MKPKESFVTANDKEPEDGDPTVQYHSTRAAGTSKFSETIYYGTKPSPRPARYPPPSSNTNNNNNDDDGEVGSTMVIVDSLKKPVTSTLSSTPSSFSTTTINSTTVMNSTVNKPAVNIVASKNIFPVKKPAAEVAKAPPKYGVAVLPASKPAPLSYTTSAHTITTPAFVTSRAGIASLVFFILFFLLLFIFYFYFY